MQYHNSYYNSAVCICEQFPMDTNCIIAVLYHLRGAHMVLFCTVDNPVEKIKVKKRCYKKLMNPFPKIFKSEIITVLSVKIEEKMLGNVIISINL